jgi:phosphoserine phosphatase RsbU/P
LKNPKNIFFIIAFIAILKLIINLFAPSVNLFGNEFIELSNTISSLIILCGLMIVFFSSYFSNNIFNSFEINKNVVNENETYFTHLKGIGIILFILYAVSVFVPKTLNDVTLEYKLIHIIAANLVTLAIIATLMSSVSIVFYWSLKRRASSTNFSRLVIITILVSLPVLDYLEFYIPWLEFWIAKPMYFIGIVSIFFASYTISSKRHWIALLKRDEKVKLSLASATLFVLHIMIISRIFSDEFDHSFDYFLRGSDMLAFLLAFVSLPFYFRIFINCILTLPASDVVERKKSEINSLTYLNKVIAENNDISHVTHIVTEIAVHSTGSIAGWTQVYKNGQTELGSIKNLNEKYFDFFKSSKSFQTYLNNLNDIWLVDSVRKNPLTKFLENSVNGIGSLVAIPINDKKELIGTLILLHKDEYGIDKNDINLLRAFRDSVSVALENSRLLEKAVESQKLLNEMQIARQMQESLLPRNLPQSDDYTIAVFSRPAEVVGGDFYDIVYLSDGSTCLLIGDVSGKGIGSAFYMAQIKGVVMSLASVSHSGIDFLKKINKTLHKKTDKKMFISLACLTLDNINNKITYTRAGHMPLILKSTDSEVKIIQPHGMAVGIASPEVFDNNIETEELDFNSGDVCFMFTDGINELRNTNGMEFGSEQLGYFFEKYSFDSAQGYSSRLYDLLLNYCENVKQYDDMTALTIKRT